MKSLTKMKKVSNLLNLINDESINQNFKREIGSTFYESIFDIKKIPNMQSNKIIEPIDTDVEKINHIKN